MKYIVEPYPHQKEILELSKVNQHLALLWEMGTGKTGAIINIIRWKFYQNKGTMRTLILSPQVTLFNWKDEFAKFSKIPTHNVHVINGQGKKRIKNLIKAIADKDDIYSLPNILIINWEALQNETIFDSLMEWSPQIIVGDEMHLIKSYKAKRAMLGVALADRCRKNNGCVFGLTGTAILNSVEDIYMQYRFLDGGHLFGDNFFRFRKNYMRDVNEGWSNRPGHFPKFEAREATFKDLHDKIYTIATRVTKAEAMPFLPPLVKTRRLVELSPQQKKMYKEMKEEFITFIKEKEDDGVAKAVIAQLAVTKALRLLQITSGYVTDEDGVEIQIPNNPRLKEIERLLEELTPNHKVILWCSFKNNYIALGDVCKKLKLKHVFITGQQTAKGKQESMIAFETDPECRVVIANRRAGGIGINLVAASYSIVYSRNFSLGEERQSEARNHRGGSQVHEKIVKIDMVAPDTIDELVLAALESKQNISNKIIDWTKENRL